MQTTMELSDELYQLLIIRAAEQGTSVRDVIEHAFRQFLYVNEDPACRVTWSPYLGVTTPRMDTRDSLLDAMDGS